MSFVPPTSTPPAIEGFLIKGDGPGASTASTSREFAEHRSPGRSRDWGQTKRDVPGLKRYGLHKISGADGDTRRSMRNTFPPKVNLERPGRKKRVVRGSSFADLPLLPPNVPPPPPQRTSASQDHRFRGFLTTPVFLACGEGGCLWSLASLAAALDGWASWGLWPGCTGTWRKARYPLGHWSVNRNSAAHHKKHTPAALPLAQCTMSGHAKHR